MITAGMMIQVSKYAMDLVKAGKAFYSSGGVRLLDGRFVELYKISSRLSNPTVMPVSPFIMSTNPIGAAAQAVNVLTPIANVVLSYKNGQKLNKVINMMSALQGIAWANTAIGATNLALTAMSFAMINSKLDELSKQISSAVENLKKEMRAIQLEDKTVEILTLIGNLKSTSHYLNVKSLSSQDEIQIENYLNSAKQLIIWLKEQFEKAGPNESGTLFTLLFDLTTMYTAVLKEYISQYYYLESCFPGNYTGWMDAFDYANSKTLQSGLKRTIWLMNPLDTTEKLEVAYDFTLNCIHLQSQDLQETIEVVPQISREVYFDFDNFVKQKIESGDVEIVEEAQKEDPRECVLLRKNGFAMA